MKSIEGAFNRLTYELIINGVEETDYGQYRCQIKNSEGSGLANVELRSKLLFIFVFSLGANNDIDGFVQD